MRITGTTLTTLIAAVTFLAGCSRSAQIATVPDDFAVRYDFAEGTVPPPYHYEFEIHIGPGTSAHIDYHPSYGPDPTWTERFDISEGARARLFELLTRLDVFSRTWEPMHEPPLGGSVERMWARADGRDVTVPFHLESDRDRRDADTLYSRIRGLVPQEVRDTLDARHERYVRENE